MSQNISLTIRTFNTDAALGASSLLDTIRTECAELVRSTSRDQFRAAAKNLGYYTSQPGVSDTVKLEVLKILDREERTTTRRSSLITLPGAVTQIGLSGGPVVKAYAVKVLNGLDLRWKNPGVHSTALEVARRELLMNRPGKFC